MIEGKAIAGEPSASQRLVEMLKEASLQVVLAESCTAGLAADMIARIPGASRVLWGSFVSYTVDAKIAMLGIDAEKIAQYGAVSRETACAMARGALERSGAGLAAAVTGLAGPDGDGSGTPVGTVWIAAAFKGGPEEARQFNFSGSRSDIRNAAAGRLIEELLALLTS